MSLKRFKRKIRKKLRNFVGKKIKRFHYYYLWPRYYKKYSAAPINPKKVVFAYNAIYKQLPDNFRIMKDYLEKRGYECVEISCGAGFRKSKIKIINLLLYVFDAKPFFQALGDAKVLFLHDYYFPAYANKPREGQSIVQLWHGCGAFKKWGYSTAEKSWGASQKELDLFPIHNTYTHVCVSSPKVRFAYAEAFGTDESNIFPLGVPRTDVYFDESFVKSGREELLRIFPGIGDRKILLYAPTFRGNRLRTAYMKNTLDLERMREELGRDYALVLKLHPLTARGFEIPEGMDDFVFNASTGVNIDTALCAADLVVTDYSSLIFEYALLERPMIFYAFDLEDYEDSRSFYFDYKTFVPGEIVVDTEEMISEVKRLETGFDVERVRKFKQDFMSACDGHSTERIAETVLGDDAS